MNELTPTQRVEQEISWILAHRPEPHQRFESFQKFCFQLATELEMAWKEYRKNILFITGEWDKERDSLRQQLADKTRECEAATALCSINLEHELLKLRAENTELKKDKERLDWIDAHDCTIFSDNSSIVRYSLDVQVDGHTESIHESVASLRTAIDSARKEQG